MANFDVTKGGISLQAMDTSHVSLVTLGLKSEGFDPYRCDRAVTLGLNIASVSKIIKCLANDDTVTMKANDDADTISFMFENDKKERISEYEMKLMDINTEALGIPDTPATATVKMPSGEFQRIVRDLAVMGDSITITVTKEGVKFSTEGELGTGNITIRQTQSADAKDDDKIVIDLDEPVSLTFPTRYFMHYTKATSLSPTVLLSLMPENPMSLTYMIGEMGSIRYFLAPKIDEGEEEEGEEGEEGEDEDEE